MVFHIHVYREKCLPYCGCNARETYQVACRINYFLLLWILESKSKFSEVSVSILQHFNSLWESSPAPQSSPWLKSQWFWIYISYETLQTLICKVQLESICIAFFNQWHMISKMGLMNSEANVHFEEKEPGVWLPVVENVPFKRFMQIST